MTAETTLEQRPSSDDGETLNRDTPIFLAEDEPITAGLLPDSGSQEHLIVPPPD
ncbi:MAG TPA: hypothetical protein VHI14_11820 [Jatrophihabitantaceae bacterium]|jgi:hypothetical protein|nr:hypothetical protein [Jatrophihabitantaceae bacterium]